MLASMDRYMWECGCFTARPASRRLVTERMTVWFQSDRRPHGRLSTSCGFPASLLGCGLANLGDAPVRYGVPGLLAPFRPERIAEPGESHAHRHRECSVERVREL